MTNQVSPRLQARRQRARSADRFRSGATALILTMGLVAFGCNGVQVNTYSADAGGTSCGVAPSLTCDAVDASAASCTAQAGGTGNAASLPTDASFPPGCQAYFRGADCSSRGFCTCDGEDEAGAPAHWNCHDAVDGGT